ncbi:MAG: hypothetical protein IK083_04960 [Abditibacteriota bacterium]|nr:hypothetical protein [Abditibacteriota bacterium]
MYVLENAALKAVFDERGRLTCLSCGGVNVIDAPADETFFANLTRGTALENPVYSSEQAVTVRCSRTRLRVSVEGLSFRDGRGRPLSADISLVFTAELKKDGLIFSAEADNRSPFSILDFEYPIIGKVRDLGAGAPSLFWPEPFGALYTDIGRRLAAGSHRENGSNCMKLTYPGYGIMGYCALTDRENTLSLSLRDPDFYSCALKVRGYPKEPGCVSLSCTKFLCAGPGRTAAPPVKVTLGREDWHGSVRDYAKWMNAHRPRHAAPRWTRDMSGFFLVIMKQQFGCEMWGYEDLPLLWRLAREHGCDTLGLFGWYGTGHDNNYPDIGPGDSLGGAKALKKAIRAVQKEGGRVVLYHQGHLIDRGSPFYGSGAGKSIACKTVWGQEYGEYYPKSHKSDALQLFSNKLFSIACPSSPEWQALMTKKLRELAALGADGCLFDQIGGMPPYLCFDSGHPHKDHNPALALTGGQREMLARLEREARTRGPEYAFLSENITDLYSPYLDAVHGIGYWPGRQGERAVSPESGTVIRYPEVFRYAFPDTVITVRNPQPTAPRRLTNFAFVFGAPLELEIRYSADKEDVLGDAFREDREYALTVSGFRKKYRKYLSGRFADTDGIEGGAPALFAKAYVKGPVTCVALWNDSGEPALPDIRVPGRELVFFATPEGEYSDQQTMAPDTVGLAVYR